MLEKAGAVGQACQEIVKGQLREGLIRCLKIVVLGNQFGLARLDLGNQGVEVLAQAVNLLHHRGWGARAKRSFGACGACQRCQPV